MSHFNSKLNSFYCLRKLLCLISTDKLEQSVAQMLQDLLSQLKLEYSSVTSSKYIKYLILNTLFFSNPISEKIDLSQNNWIYELFKVTTEHIYC